MFAVPVNSKLPYMITDQHPEQYKADLKNGRNPSHRYYLAEVGEWAVNMKRPTCKIIDSIGEAGNLEAESLRILHMNDICTDSYEVNGHEPTHECLKVFTNSMEGSEWKIPEQEIAQRLDLRSKRVFSIDPITARDIDDALSIEKISDTFYEIGVHIADVSFFVPQGSDLDKEALKRGTSTYFVHKVFPMLPRLLSENLCSLKSNVDRLTYSVFFRLDLKTGYLVKDFDPVIKRSVIRSCAKWNYDLVEQIIDGQLESEESLAQELRP